MKLGLCIGILVQGVALVSASASRLDIDKLGEPFYSANLKVVWKATNNPPAAVRVFKVVPGEFSTAVISNILALGGFTERDALKAPRNTRAFSKENEQRTLSIAPKFGVVIYSDGKAEAAIHPREPVEGLPDDAEAVRLASAILPKLELSGSDFMPKADGTGPNLNVAATRSRGYGDKATGKLIHEDVARSVSLARQLDTFEIVGGGQQGVRVTFGNHARISSLELNWSRVKLVGSYPFASPKQIVEWIRQGRARVASLETTGARWIDVKDIKQLAVLEISPRYFAGHRDEPLDTWYPYALLKAEAELSRDDKEIVWLSCPIIAEALSSASRKTGEFSIYPSALYERSVQQGATAN
jgi:hypothetical protein